MKKHYYTSDILEICDCNHYTVDEIFEALQKKFPEVGRSSIYRNVEQLVEKGELKKIQGMGPKALFEKSISPHAHFICQNSGRVIDIPLSKIPAEILPENVEIDYVDLKIYGRLK